jgi:hypothetical protein
MENRNGFRVYGFLVKLSQTLFARNDDNASRGPHCATGGFLLRTLPVWAGIQAKVRSGWARYLFSQLQAFEMRPEPPGTI